MNTHATRHLPIALSVLLVLCSLSSTLGQQQQCFNITSNYEPYVYEMGFKCAYYSPVTCCSRDLAYNLGRGESALERMLYEVRDEQRYMRQPTGCRDALTMLLCMPCSPSTANFITKTKAPDGSPVVEVAVCRSFCDLIYDKCSTIYGWIFEEFKNGEGLCNALLFNSTNYIHEGATFKLTQQVPTGKCFNKAGHTAVPGHVIVVFVIALLCCIFAIIV